MRAVLVPVGTGLHRTSNSDPVHVRTRGTMMQSGPAAGPRRASAQITAPSAVTSE